MQIGFYDKWSMKMIMQYKRYLCKQDRLDVRYFCMGQLDSGIVYCILLCH